MPSDAHKPGRGLVALDLLNFFLANAQTGFGAFIAVYLTSHKWTQVQIGLVLSLGTAVAMISQVPAGALVDALPSKRVAAGAGILGIMVSALLLALWPAELPVLLAQVLHSAGSAVITPAIAAISLQLVGHTLLGDRLGRNTRYAAAGNGIAAAVMGTSGAYFSSRAVFWLTALLCIPALAALAAISRGPHARQQTTVRGFDRGAMRSLLLDHRLLLFAACVVLFQLADAAMLPLAATSVTMRAGDFANLIIAACIVLPQGVVALCAPRIGRAAAERGRRPMLLLGWSVLPLRGVLLAVLPGPYLLVAAQAVSGISAAVFGVMLPLIAADLTRGTAHFNLCLGLLGLALAIGGGLSTALAGWIAGMVGTDATFLCLSVVGLAGAGLLWAVMPETAQPELSGST